MQPSFVAAAFGGVCILLAGSGCVTPYRTPAASEPHAVVTFRRNYQRTGGELLSEWLLVDGKGAFDRNTWSAEIDGPIIDTLRVPPVAARFTARALFTHPEIRNLTGRFHGRVPDLRLAASGCPQATCVREITDFKTGQRTPHISRYPDVSDGTCTKQVEFHPLVNHRYELHFTYLTNGACSLSCNEQIAREDGQVTNVPCGSDVVPGTSQPEAPPQAPR